jgi:hypothetical protein
MGKCNTCDGEGVVYWDDAVFIDGWKYYTFGSAPCSECAEKGGGE